MKRQIWSAEEVDVLRRLYPQDSARRIACLLGRSTVSVRGMVGKLKLRKGPGWENNPLSGILRKGETRPESVASQFKKGHVPANKGLRRPGYAAGRMAETQFKAGTRSGAAARNWVPVGTVLVDPDGYKRIKVRETQPGEASGFGNSKAWPQYHRHLWEREHGPIPAGRVVVFRDGDRRHCSLDNLELISRSELARRNTMWGRYPRELAEAIQLNGALKRKLRRIDGKK